MRLRGLIIGCLAVLAGCDASQRTRGGGDLGASGDLAQPCYGVACQKVQCREQPSTSLSGTVYAPNGTLPLYNVAVFIPGAPLKELPSGARCDRCGTTLSGQPIVTALSDEHGHFRLEDVPAGSNVPLVVQLGKWRRVVTLPELAPCQDNPLTDPDLTRLPKNRDEGDMPRIAVTLGQCDQISCMLPKVGIDPVEFGVAGQDRAVTFYSTPSQKALTGVTSATQLWNNAASLAAYDMVILSCECDEAPASKNATSYAAMADYLAMGGRIFSTDFQYTWYKFSPDAQLRSIATIPGGAPGGASPILLQDAFPKGKALAQWMKFTGLSAQYGKIDANEVFDNFTSADPTKTQTWATSGGHPRFLTINTPVGLPPDQQCGKATHLDAHINDTDTIDSTFPGGCTSSLASTEGAFAFFFFDLASCIQDESAPPTL